MRGSLLLAAVSFSLASCHLQLLLDGQGFACESDDNCPEGQRCVAEICVPAEQMDAAGLADAGAASDAAVGSDTGLLDRSQPLDAAEAADSRVPVDATGVGDSNITLDSTSASDSNAASDLGAPSDVAQPSDSAIADSAVAIDAGPRPAVLASGQSNARFLILSDGFLYWSIFSNAGAIRRVSIGGGPTQTVTSVNSGKPNALVADSDNIYFQVDDGVSQTDFVYQVNKTDTLQTPVLIASGQDFKVEDMARCLFRHGNDLIWLHRGAANAIRRHPLDQGANVFVGASPSRSYNNSLGLVGDRLFVVNDIKKIEWVTAGFAEAANTAYVADLPRGVFAVASNSTHLYWGLKRTANAAGHLVSVAYDGSVTTISDDISLGTSHQQIFDIAADDNDLYYTVPSGIVANLGRIFHVQLGANPSVTMFLNDAGDPRGIVFDSSYVYFVDDASQAIRRVPR